MANYKCCASCANLLNCLLPCFGARYTLHCQPQKDNTKCLAAMKMKCPGYKPRVMRERPPTRETAYTPPRPQETKKRATTKAKISETNE